MRSWMTTVVVMLLVFISMIFGQGIPKTAYVVNSVANTLSVINLENGTVQPDILSPGANSMPNHLVLRNGKGYVVDSGINDIMVFDQATLQEIKRINLPNGSNPWAIEFINDSLAAVTLYLTDQVVIVNVFTDQIIQTVQVGTSPAGLKYYNGKIYVTNTGYITYTQPYEPGTISIIDAGSFTVIDSIMVSTNPQALDVDSQGRLVIACTGDYYTISGKLEIVDTAIDTVVASVDPGAFITSVNVNALDKAYLPAAFGLGVLVYDLSTQTFERDMNNPLPGAGWGIAFDVQHNAYIADPGDWASAGTMRVFSSAHQTLSSYTVNIGPVFVAVYDPASTGIAEAGEPLPESFRLLGNYPNPFNPSTTIEFELYRSGKTSLDVFNPLGQKISTLLSGYLSAGLHRVKWNGRDGSGRPRPSGTYLYRLEADGGVKTGRMQLIK